MRISFTYYGVARGVLSIDGEFYIGIDSDLSLKGITIILKIFLL
ncbi:hypothetical protein SAMN05216347_1177 [Streptococcus equinus]|uniref:Uncharacterized protein n=1 Tax=Streptococcus equinus TaxID=1335 RepID=A0A1H0RFL0_STREI|nr:hypothetical protein SAMN05216347_1177 [Streptococcus equinus]